MPKTVNGVERKKLKNGEMRYRCTIRIKGQRRRTPWVSSVSEARHLRTETEKDLRRALDLGVPVVTESTVDEVYQDFLKIAPMSMSEHTIRRMDSIYRHHLRPHFGHRKIKTLKPFEIQVLWVEKLEVLSASYVSGMHTCLNKLFTYLVDNHLITYNPMTNVKRPRPEDSEIHPWTSEELADILEASKPRREYIIFWLGAITGMRVGEILGLRWSDINFSKGTISVKRTLSCDDNTVFLPPKTKNSRREIFISKQHVSFLKKYKLQQGNGGKGLVCTTRADTAYYQTNVGTVLRQVCDEVGLEYRGTHNFRHTHATLLIRNGANVKDVSLRLGHGKIETTLKLYVHPNEDDKKKTAEMVAQII